MKKITSLFTLLLLAFCSIGASAQTTVTVTVCDNTSYVDTKGTWADVSNNLYKTFTTGSASGLAGLTITSDAYVMRQGYYQSYKYTYQIVGTPGVSNTITLTAPSGYVIVSYALTTMKTSTSSSNTSVIVTAEDGTNTGSFNTANGTNLSVSNVNASSTYFVVAPTSNNPSVELNIFNFTITLEKLPFTASTSANPIWYAMSTANTASWWQANSNNTINNNNNRSLPSGTADAYAWAFYGDPTNGYKIQNKSTGRYLGGRTASGGALTLVEEANAVLFVPIFNNSILKWKSKDYGYYVDRASGEPYAHTSGQGINFADLYDVNFTCSQNDVTAVQVGGVDVNVGTNVLIATTAQLTISGYAIAKYDGYSTLSEALTSGAANDGVNSLLVFPILQNLASANSSKAYTITTPRGYYNVESADATVFGATAGTPDYTVDNNYWTFVTIDGNTYLYNVTTNKFGSLSAGLVTSAPATLSAVASTTSNVASYPLVLQMTKDGTTYTMNMDGQCNVLIDNWSTHDAGNTLQIVEIPGVTVTPEAYKVNFTNTTGSLTSVYVDGTEVALSTDVILTSGATVSSGASVNAIETYNGYSTLAEALANLGGTTGTIDVALPAVLSNITINVMRGSTVVKTVTLENVPENDVIIVADAVGVPYYVTALTPATITATDEDQTVSVTYTSTLPFTLSDDPTSANATAYLMTLRTAYAHGNNTSTTCDLGDDTYYWTFGGDEYNGITVYNKTNGYMSVGSNADNSVATFSTTPTNFEIKPNASETNGFNLNIPGTNAYINSRNNRVSTWLNTYGNGDVGSCLKVYTDADVLPGLLEALAPYFTYAGSVGALTESAAADLNSTYQSFLANTPHSSLYLALKDAIDNNLVELSEGYYIVYSGYDGFTTPKAMYYNTSNNKIAWTTADGSAAQVMKLKAVSGTSNYRIYSPLTDKYLQTKDGATTDAEESGLILTVTPVSVGKVVLVYNANGGNDAALHTDGHNNGSGTSGNLKGWNTTGAASMWRLYPLDIPEITLIEPNGVAEGDEVYQSFAYGSNKQLPLNVGVHYISTNSGNFAHIETVSSSAIRANEGYIIRGVKGATVPLLPIGEVDALSSTNLLVGVVEPTKVYSGYMLAYKGNDAEQKFYKIKNTGLTIPAYRSYLTAAAAANVRGLELLFGGIGDDEITGIDGINTGGTEGAIFDLQGRRVTKPEKGGIYIINGKKVMK